MNQINTKGIVLGRTDFGEADRIITVLTPDRGKLRLMAKGVRKVKSKLAGGIELFSTSDITYIQGRGEIGTLVSTRLITHYGNITKDIERVQLGYELIKLLNKTTEDETEAEYYKLLDEAFRSLDDAGINLDLIRLWFQAQLLKFAGHSPNLQTDTLGNKLQLGQSYNFDYEAVSFAPHNRGNFAAGVIKFLRLVFASSSPKKLAQIQGAEAVIQGAAALVGSMLSQHLNS